MMRTQIPKFRLPETVLDEEVDYILDLQPELRLGQRVDSLKAVLAEGYDAIFVGCGAPRGRELEIPGRKEAAANIHIGIDWLSSVSFGHTDKIGQRVIVLGGGNTAMDCCRTSRRLGGDDVNVVVRSGFEEMKASPWEKEDAMREGIPIHNFLVPKEFTHDKGRLTGVMFEKVKAEYDAKGRRKLVPSGEPDVHMECDDVLVAVGQENAFPWIERDIGIEFDNWDMPKVDAKTMQSTQSESVLRRRRGVRSQEHHLGGCARPRSGDLDRSRVQRRGTSSERPPPLVNLMQPEDGHSRVELRQRYLPGQALQGAACAERDRAQGRADGSRARLRREAGVPGGGALPELRRADGVRRAEMHRVRRLRRHLPDGLHHLHDERRGDGSAHAADGAGDACRRRISMSPTV